MNIYATRKVFDMVTRQAMYIEQVKLGEAQQFNAVLSEIDEVFRKNLALLEYDNLDALSRAQLNAFLSTLRKSQSVIYSRYQKELIDRLNKFMKAAVVQTMRAAASVYAFDFEADTESEGPELLSFDKAKDVVELAMKKNDNTSLFGFLVLGGTTKGFAFLWSKIVNSPMPSGGALPINYLNTAIASAMLNLENTVRNAYANKQTKQELITQALGSKRATGPSSTLKRTGNTMRAVLSTTMQHFSQNAINAASSALWPEYVWVSVIDDATSAICRSRNLKRYRYGSGPLPPAHTYCRSGTMPFDYWNAGFEVPSFYDWLKGQPASFIRSLFGAKIAAKFKDGSIRRKDFEKFTPTNSISIADFLTRTGDLL